MSNPGFLSSISTFASHEESDRDWNIVGASMRKRPDNIGYHQQVWWQYPNRYWSPGIPINTLTPDESIDTGYYKGEQARWPNINNDYKIFIMKNGTRLSVPIQMDAMQIWALAYKIQRFGPSRLGYMWQNDTLVPKFAIPTEQMAMPYIRDVSDRPASGRYA